jgi:hypothetical protein
MLERAERDAPLCNKVVERSDKLVLQTVAFIITRVWFIFMPTISNTIPLSSSSEFSQELKVREEPASGEPEAELTALERL